FVSLLFVLLSPARFTLFPYTTLFRSAELVPALQPLLDRPYVLFGHSMGAMVAYEVAQRLRPAPGMVFVSGRRVPGGTGERHLLGDRDLLGVVNGLGGTPSALLDSPELAALFLREV